MPLQMPDLSQLLNRATAEAHRGNLESSREAIKRIRETYAIERMPDVSAEVMIAEGICEAYAGRLDAGFDRFRRAALVAHHYGSRPIEQLALSWLAHCEFNRGHPLESVKYIGQAHQDIENARPDARFRISSTIAILTEYAGMTDSAAHWSRIARREASKCGERAMMSSIIYNMAALRVDSKLANRLTDKDSCNRGEHASNLLFMRSAQNYDSSTDMSLQGELHFLMQGQSLICMGRYQEAIGYLNRFIVSKCGTASSVFAVAKFERAWCMLKTDEVDYDIDELLNLVSLIEHPDDLALAYNTLSQIKDLNGCAEESAIYRQTSLRLQSEANQRKLILEVALRERDLSSVPSIWTV